MARIASRVSATRLRELARTDAEHTVKQLRADIIAIERTFSRGRLTTLNSDH